jgi:hypothetical protein
MSENKKTITLGKIKQLIDLNGDSTNFDLSFKVTCHDDTPFNLLVVDQTTLDNTPELVYKDATKSISGSIIADKNLYQNYFLILKSETPCNVDIEIKKKVLPKTPTVPIETLDDSSSIPMRRIVHPPQSQFPWKKIGLIVIVLLIGLSILWYLYKRNNYVEPSIKNSFTMGEQNNTNLPSNNKQPTPFKTSPVLNSSIHSQGPMSSRTRSFRQPIVSPVLISQSSTRSCTDGNSLLHRLRKFAR